MVSATNLCDQIEHHVNPDLPSYRWYVAGDWRQPYAAATTGFRLSGIVESREKDFLTQELQGGCDRDGDESPDNPE